MFDNTKPNVILLTDHTDTVFMQKCLGPLKVAHELRKNGYEVLVINHLHIFSPDELLYILKEKISDQTLFVGINNFFYRALDQGIKDKSGAIYYPFCNPGTMLPHSDKLNRPFKNFIQEQNTNCKIVLGGPSAADAEWNKEFDYIVCGYSDLSIVNLANHLRTGETLRKSHKSIYGPIIVNDPKAEGFDIGTATMSYKDHDVILPGETLTIEISRGCIFNCAFCSYPLNGKKKIDFIRSEELLYQEFLENYKKYGVTRYIFSDDTFNDNLDKVQMVHNISKRLPFEIEYWAYIRLDLVSAHPQSADLLIESGLRGCFFGIESLNKPTGEIIGKSANKEKLFNTLNYLKNKWKDKIMLHGNFIVGLPEETVETVTDTYNTVLDENCPLDSWNFEPYFLEDVSVKSNQFLSQLSLNPEKYGYRIKEKKNHLLVWENDHMDFNKAVELAEKFNNTGIESGRMKLNSIGSFYISNLGFDLDFSINKKVVDVDWYKITQHKEQRAIEYKQNLFNILTLTPPEELRLYSPDNIKLSTRLSWGVWWE